MVRAQGWYSITVSGSATSEEAGVAQSLLEMAAHRGDALPAPVIPAVTTATWERPTPECVDLGVLIAAPDGSPITNEGENPKRDSLLRPLYDLLGKECNFSMPNPDPDGTSNEVSFTVTVVPGGAVAFDAGVISGKGTPLETTNGEAAAVLMPIIYEGSSAVFATDGTNTVAIEVAMHAEASDFGWVAEQLIDGLAP
ncbi:hypothetical protein ACQUSY_06085 [Microbacterium sp. YY-03]|uniref:hypothetical protein n=1 Tax=Microbacterium sp. YY-03 TaxID=3421636 RepID=UPI003D16720A